MFGISGIELFLIVVFVLIVFGPDKLPQFGRTIGRFMREFKRAQESMESVIRAEMYSSDNKPAEVESPASPATGPGIPEDDEEEEDEEE